MVSVDIYVNETTRHADVILPALTWAFGVFLMRQFFLTVPKEILEAARKLVLATGQDGTGEWWMPDFVRALPAERRAHSADMIDFERLRGRTVAVLGVGASAMDNAAVALEHGARADVFCRRQAPSMVQQYRWLTFAGFLKHMGDLPDEWRWRIMSHIMRSREGFPADTYQRVLAFPDFRMHVGRPWTGATMEDVSTVLYYKVLQWAGYSRNLKVADERCRSRGWSPSGWRMQPSYSGRQILQGRGERAGTKNAASFSQKNSPTWVLCAILLHTGECVAHRGGCCTGEVDHGGA